MALADVTKKIKNWWKCDLDRIVNECCGIAGTDYLIRLQHKLSLTVYDSTVRSHLLLNYVFSTSWRLGHSAKQFNYLLGKKIWPLKELLSIRMIIKKGSTKAIVREHVVKLMHVILKLDKFPTNQTKQAFQAIQANASNTIR